MTNEEIDALATIKFGNNSATEHYKAWVEGFKDGMQTKQTTIRLIADEILKKYEDLNEYHFHKCDRSWIIDAMLECSDQSKEWSDYSKVFEIINYINKVTKTNIIQDFKKRLSKYVKARHIAIYLIKYNTNLSLARIGEHFGNVRHSTILSAINSVKNQLETNRLYKEYFNEIKKDYKHGDYNTITKIKKESGN